MDSFISAKHNPNKTLEERMDFPLQVVRAMRKEVGPEFPIIYRFSQWSVEDYQEIKWNNSKELKVWVEALRDAGVDILHVSTRSVLQPAFPEEDDSKSLAEWSKELSGLPVIGVGKIAIGVRFLDKYSSQVIPVEDPTPAIEMVEQGKVDMLAIGRSLIANPDWVPLVKSGNWKSLKPFESSVLKTIW